MITRLKRMFETVLISTIVFVAIDGAKRHIPTDLRDAVRDTGAIEQVSNTSLKDIKPDSVSSAALKVEPASDWTAYVRDAEGDKDVFVSKIYSDKKSAQEVMSAVAAGLETGGKRILFSALLKETAGGSFYVIRLDNSQAVAPQASVVSNNIDKAYVSSVKNAADNIENTCRGIWE